MRTEFLDKINQFFKNRPLLSKVVRILSWAALAMTVIFMAIYFMVYSSIPSKNELKAIQNFTSSEIYSEDGVLLGKYYIQDRTNVEFQDISPALIKALIATEDARFYEHHGVDTRGMFRVMIKSILLHDESSGGGSTISQQLAKNVFPRKKYWMLSLPINKLREMLIARKIEGAFSKNEILTLYLNTVPFGENAYGVATASKRFFNKKPIDLGTEESAVLVGMLKGTTYYNPKRNPDRAKERRNVVLNQMVKYEYLTREMADSLKALPLVLHYTFNTHNEGLATYFRENLRHEVQEWLNKHPKDDGTSYNVYTDGLKIHTNINSKMQKYAEEAVRQHMNDLQKTFYAHWGKKNPWGNNKDVIQKAIERSDRYILLKEQGYSEEEINKIFKTPVKMKIFSYKGEQEKKMSPLDSIKYYLRFLHPGFLVMESGSGKIKAWVGGIDYHYFKYDHVNLHTKRQVGSTFKPIVYAAALQQGVDPCEYINNEQKVYEDYDDWSPRNADNTYGGMYSMQGGLTNSVNTVSAQLIMRAGINNVTSLAQNMGIESPLEPVPSLALGTADISLYEMVRAFSVFANRGVYVEPNMVAKITDSKGNVIFDSNKNKKKHRVIGTDKADMMTKMLQNVVDHGTGARLRYKFALEGDIAGKTGTTQQHADGWFIGYTPKLVAGAWVGAEDRRIHFRSLDMGQGASMALPIWGIFMNKVYKDKQFSYYWKIPFPKPSEEVMTKLSCADFIPPDTTNSPWWWPFEKKEPEVVSMNAPKTQEIKREKVKQESAIEKIKGLFKKKKR
jgi:penicillin-binding protein 1A